MRGVGGALARSENEPRGHDEQRANSLSLPGVGFGMLIIGILPGICREVTSSDHGLLTNLLVGIAGSFVGGTRANLMHVEFYGWVGNLVVASIGAIIVLWIWRRFRDRSPAS
jgi:uncharacterized membrane protein YeaQ/YmgE (transglycosylase-associated protein family)